MTLYRATVVDTPGDPFTGDPADALAADSDGGRAGPGRDHRRPWHLSGRCTPSTRTSR